MNIKNELAIQLNRLSKERERLQAMVVMGEALDYFKDFERLNNIHFSISFLITCEDDCEIFRDEDDNVIAKSTL